jgi:hypothetical protein
LVRRELRKEISLAVLVENLPGLHLLCVFDTQAPQQIDLRAGDGFLFRQLFETILCVTTHVTQFDLRGLAYTLLLFLSEHARAIPCVDHLDTRLPGSKVLTPSSSNLERGFLSPRKHIRLLQLGLL